MTSTMYIKLNSDGTYTELTEAEFKSKPGANTATVVSVKHSVLTTENPEAEKKLDSQTPHISARRFLQELFPTLSYSAANSLTAYLLVSKGTLFILK